jgi:S-DNA-T family DNA segregation ATPase FtsK/SpoIIIE
VVTPEGRTPGQDVQVRPGDWVIPADDRFALTPEQAASRPYDAEVAHRAPDELGEPVDLPDAPRGSLYTQLLKATAVQRTPILDARWTTSAGRKHLGRALKSAAAYKVKFHAAHAIPTLAQWIWWFAAGLGIAIYRGWGWLWDREGKLAIKNREKNAEIATLRKARWQEIGHRWTQLGVATGLASAAILALLLWPGTTAAVVRRTTLLAAALGLVVGIVALVKLGKPEEARWAPEAVRTIGGWSRLTTENVRTWLIDIGVIKNPEDVTFPAAIRSVGIGDLAVVQLPRGKTVAAVMAKQEELASAALVPMDQIVPDQAVREDAPGHQVNPGTLALLLAYKPMSEMDPEDWPQWPLARADARTDWFKPAPFAHDIRCRPVTTQMAEVNTAVGGRPGAGKTGYTRVFVGIAMLDPSVELKLAELKQAGDLMDVESMCSTYISGADREHLEQGLQMLLWLEIECRRRGARITAARKAGKAPDSKVTREIADDPRSGLHPIFAALVEAQVLFEDPEFGAAAGKAATNVARLGRALGIHLLIDTQIPDAASIPPRLFKQIALRICCAVMDHIANNMILGTGAYKRGWDSTKLRPVLDAGWSWFRGIFNPIKIHSYYPDNATWRRMCKRAMQLRNGQVVGAPIDASTVPPPRDVLIDITEIFERKGWDRAQWVELVPELAAAWPQTYAELTASALSADARGTGKDSRLPHRSVRPKDGSGATLKGCLLSDVRAAIERRQVEGQEHLAIESGDDPDEWTEQLDDYEDADPDEDPDAEADDLPDDLVLSAAEQVILTQHGSTPMLARKLRIDPADAEQLMDELCALEVVGAVGSAGRYRKVLVASEDAREVLARLRTELDR